MTAWTGMMKDRHTTSTCSSWRELLLYCGFATVVSVANVGVAMLVLF